MAYGGLQLIVAEQLLDVADVRPTHQQVQGEAMSKRVGRGFQFELFGVFADGIRDHRVRESAARHRNHKAGERDYHAWLTALPAAIFPQHLRTKKQE